MIISHYSLLGTLSTRPPVKGVRKTYKCSATPNSIAGGLKRKNLYLLPKKINNQP